MLFSKNIKLLKISNQQKVYNCNINIIILTLIIIMITLLLKRQQY